MAVIDKVVHHKGYPWMEWTNGKAHQLTKGKEITIDPRRLRTNIYSHARRKGYTVEVAVNGDSIQFQFKKKKPSKPKTRK